MMSQQMAVALERETERGIPWKEDFENRLRPELMTELIREAVPAVRACGWFLSEVREGAARSTLPLNEPSTNQHGTHQATVMALAADYTGGTAIATLLSGIPVVGVHPAPTDEALLLWLVRMDVEYRQPSTDDLTVACEIPEEMFGKIREAFDGGRRLVLPLEVRFTAGDQLIARATMVYYLQHAGHTRPQSAEERLRTLYSHKIKASARLIAAIRALEEEDDDPLYDDPYSAAVAGKHGALLATHFLRLLPPLRMMVAARTRHLDDCLARALAHGVTQVVTVGAGLDCRPYRLAAKGYSARYFELDLPEMLDERESSLDRVNELPEVERVGVPVNLEFQDPADVLAATPDFDPSKPVFVISEGTSMYFPAGANERVYQSLRRLLRHPKSRLWTDVVTPEVVTGGSGFPEATAFVEGMAKLGEPFKFGVDRPREYFDGLGFEVVDVAESNAYCRAEPNPVFSQYRFVLLGRNGERE